jgi:Flp pilus assembly protein TadG
MMAFMKRLARDKRGNALLIAAGALPLVIGSAGLASDTIQWAMWKRQLQHAADAAALAGVHGIVESQSYTAAATRDLTINDHTGIAYSATPVIVHPSSGTYATDPYAVQVTLALQKKLSFSSLFLASPPTISATAIATVVASGKYCVISLEDTAASGITYSGNATLDLGCGMSTNSNGATAVNASGSSSVTASPISAVGGIPSSSSFASGTTLQAYSMAQKDPFATIEPPAVPNGCNNYTVGTNDVTTLSGCFKNLTIHGTATLTGNIILDGGNLTIGSQAVVTCNGCTIFLTNKNAAANSPIGNVDINAGATLNMTAPTSGTYSGILFYQDRRATDGSGANYQNHINGNASSKFQGAFYFPKQEIYLNGTSGMNTVCVQMVGRRVDFSGNTSISNSCPAGSGTTTFDGSMIRLVA